MNKRWLRLTAIVAEREIRQRGRSRAFMVSTIVLLLVVAAGRSILRTGSRVRLRQVLTRGEAA
jgi:hypothetical protein